MGVDGDVIRGTGNGGDATIAGERSGKGSGAVSRMATRVAVTDSRIDARVRTDPAVDRGTRRVPLFADAIVDETAMVRNRGNPIVAVAPRTRDVSAMRHGYATDTTMVVAVAVTRTTGEGNGRLVGIRVYLGARDRVLDVFEVGTTILPVA